MKRITMVLIAAVIVFLYQMGCGSQMRQPEKAEPMTEIKFTTIKLNPPDLAKGIPVMQALSKRKSDRGFIDKKLSFQQLSELLWSANGVNRPDGKRTAPSAVNKHPVDIYVVLAEGIFMYDPPHHQLLPVAEGDFRKQAGRQDFVSIAPVNLVYVADLSKLKDMPRHIPDEEAMKWIYCEAGLIAENVHLYCASEGLGAVIRASVDKEALGQSIKLRDEQVILLAQTVGYIK